MTTDTAHTLPLRALAALLTYPHPELIAALPEIGEVIAQTRVLRAADKERLGALLARLSAGEQLEQEEAYVGLFDRGRRTSLHLFEHLHGESRDRGAAMVDLLHTYEGAGLYLKDGELPDYLPALLEFVSCIEAAQARLILADCAHLLRPLGETLVGKGSDYACIFEAILYFTHEAGLDWTNAPSPPEEDFESLDKEWQEQPAFNGSNQQQAQTDTIHFMPKPARLDKTGAQP